MIRQKHQIVSARLHEASDVEGDENRGRSSKNIAGRSGATKPNERMRLRALIEMIILDMEREQAVRSIFEWERGWWSDDNRTGMLMAFCDQLTTICNIIQHLTTL